MYSPEGRNPSKELSAYLLVVEGSLGPEFEENTQTLEKGRVKILFFIKHITKSFQEAIASLLPIGNHFPEFDICIFPAPFTYTISTLRHRAILAA